MKHKLKDNVADINLDSSSTIHNSIMYDVQSSILSSLVDDGGGLLNQLLIKGGVLRKPNDDL